MGGLRRTWVGCLVFVVTGMSAAMAQDAELAPESDVLAEPQQQELRQQVVELSERLRAMEAQSDTFSVGIGEVSFDLAALLAQQGLHADAVTLYQRADQVMRVRDGLYSETRAAALARLHQQYRAMNDWDNAQASLTTLAWLTARNSGADSPEYIAPLKDLVSWHLSMNALDTGRDGLRELIQAYEYGAQAEEIARAHQLPVDMELIDLILAVNYGLWQHAPLPDSGTASSTVRQMERNITRELNLARGICRDWFSEDDSASNACVRRASSLVRGRSRLALAAAAADTQSYDFTRSAFFLGRSYARGRASLLDALASDQAQASAQMQFDLVSRLAEWALIFDYRATVSDTYATLVGLVPSVESAYGQTLEEPGLIKATSLAAFGLARMENPRTAPMTFRLDVGPLGQVENLRLLESATQDPELIAYALARVTQTRFRPAFVNGSAVGYENWILTVELPY